jgi:hypothetical protein
MIEQGLAKWRVVTDSGTIETTASKYRAKRNAKFRLVMQHRAYSRPDPGDLAEMRDIEVLRCERIG